MRHACGELDPHETPISRPPFIAHGDEHGGAGCALPVRPPAARTLSPANVPHRHPRRTTRPGSARSSMTYRPTLRAAGLGREGIWSDALPMLWLIATELLLSKE